MHTPSLYSAEKKDLNFSHQPMHINTSMILLPKLVKYMPIMSPSYYISMKYLHLSHRISAPP